MNSRPRAVIRESFLREGIQSLTSLPPFAARVDIANALVHSGLDYVEIASYVPTTFTEHFRDRAELLRAVERDSPCKLAAFVPNMHGLELAARERQAGFGVDAVGVAVSTSDQHSLVNLRCSIEDALGEIERMLPRVRANDFEFFCYVSTAFGYAHPLDTRETVARVVHQLLDLGCERLVLSDTTGLANRAAVAHLLQTLALPVEHVFLHMHDHRSLALQNCLEGWRFGVRGFDATLGGVGGYPPSLSRQDPRLDHGGNVDTLALIKALEACGADFERVDFDVLGNALERVAELEAVRAWSQGK